ncbi:MAG TPA: tRNA epoxyqueuosine(34) reductase QueG [Acidobacteriaceae bacterium]
MPSIDIASDRKTDRWSADLRSWLDGAATEAGFALAGVAPVREQDDAVASRDSERFASWIDSGHAGEMDYLKRCDASGSLLRGSVATAFPWARSAIVCALDYSSFAPRSIDPAPASAGWIARYAWSGRTLDDGTLVPTDYHDDLLARLRHIEAGLIDRTDIATRCYVDTGPLVERPLATEAGLGWIGKNTCLIHQQRGSWLLLGVILTSLPVEEDDCTSTSAAAAIPALAADRCGTCTRCIDACPTDALLGSRSPSAPRQMDASRCIAYLTIEKKGDIPADLREPIGRNVFGCDICQDVCPWNGRKATKVETPPESKTEGAMRPRAELVNPALDWLANMDSREFRRRFRGSPLERTGRKRLLRNVAIAMGNSGDRSFLSQLEEWAAGPADHPNDIALRDAATWAGKRLESSAE